MNRHLAPALISLIFLLPDATGGTYTMKQGAADWESPDSYDNGGERPYAGDHHEGRHNADCEIKAVPLRGKA